MFSKRTPARTAISSFLNSSPSPVDVEQIINFLRSQNLKTNKVTVYRILDLFHEKGFIKRLEFGEGKYRYEIQKSDHHHLICSSCGSVEDIEDKKMKGFEREIRTKKGFLVKNHSLEFFGVCRICQQ